MQNKLMKANNSSRKPSFTNITAGVARANDVDTEIRLSINRADEKVREQAIKQKAAAPLSTEEKIFHRKSSQ